MIKDSQNSQAGKLRDALSFEQQQHELTRRELDIAQKELQFNQRQLGLHEKREKKRADGLKKAQQARKKGVKKNV